MKNLKFYHFSILFLATLILNVSCQANYELLLKLNEVEHASGARNIATRDIFVITQKNRDSIYPGAIYYANTDLVNGVPHEVPLQKTPQAIYFNSSLVSRMSSCPKLPPYPTRVPVTYRDTKKYTSTYFDKSYESCQTGQELPSHSEANQILSQHFQSYIELKGQLGFSTDVDMVASHIDFNKFEHDDRTVYVRHIWAAHSIYEVQSKGEFSQRFDASRNQVFDHFKDVPAVVIEKVIYGKSLVLVRDSPNVKGHCHVYGDLTAAEKARFAEMSDIEECAKLCMEIVGTASKERPAYPFAFVPYVYQPNKSTKEFNRLGLTVYAMWFYK